MADDEITIRPDGTVDAVLDPETDAEYAAYLREIGREDLLVGVAEIDETDRILAVRRAMATGVYGGPGSGPRPGHKSPWYERGSRMPGVANLTSGRICTGKDAARAASKALPGKAAAWKADAETWLARNPKPEDYNSPEFDAWLKEMPYEYQEFIFPPANGSDSGAAKFLDPNPRKVAGAKAKATKFFQEQWVSYGSEGETAPFAEDLLEASADVVGREPKMQRAAERFGPIGNIVLLGENTRCGGVYMDNQDSIGIVVDKVARERLLSDRPRGLRYGDMTMSANDPVLGTIRHEFGHHVDAQLKKKDPLVHGIIRDEIHRVGTDAFRPLSRYASGDLVALGRDSQDMETFAETFAAVAHPDYDRSMLPENLHPVLRMMEELVA